MDDKGQIVKQIAGMALKGSTKKIIIVVIIISLILGLIPILYFMFKDDFTQVSKKNEKYEATVNSSGNVVYQEKLDDGTVKEVTASDMSEDFAKVLKKYIKGNEEECREKIEYLIGAETVTKLPYIEPTEGAETNQLVGQIKFYRFSDEDRSTNLKEENRLTFISQEEFENQKNNYKTGGNEEIFKHFTLDNDGNIVIAYGTTETRTISTDDNDLTLEVVKENSGEESYIENGSNGFSMTKYTISEKQIDYLSLVEQYVMPSNFLYSLLIQTNDIGFVSKIASLAYENQIAIGIYDNQAISTTTENYKYKKLMKLKVDTELDFSSVNIKNPKITADELRKAPYLPVVCRKSAFLTIEPYKYITYNYGQGSSQDSTKQVSNDYYVSKIENGKVSELGNVESAKEFTTSFNMQKTQNSIPTVGVVLADTWIAKWTSTYVKKENEPVSTANEADLEEYDVSTYDSPVSFTEEFGVNKQKEIQDKLNLEETNLKTEAIERIVSIAKGLIKVDMLTVDNISEGMKITIFNKHFSDCDYCQNIMPGKSREEVYKELNGKLKNTSAPKHFTNALNSYINEQNAKINTSSTTEQIRTDLTNQIISQVSLTGNKSNVNIYRTISYNRTSSTYERDENIEQSNAGEKFKEVFNNKAFFESRQAILDRVEWFWEYIDQNEDTAKLKDVIKYLFNIATDSEKFGKFTEEQIKNLFKAFQPKMLSTTSKNSYSQAFAEWLKSYENNDLRCYLNGQEEYYNSVTNYIKVDNTTETIYGKMYFTDFDGCWNYTYGIMVCDANGNINNEALFAKYGYDLEDLVREAKSGGEALIPIEDLDKIYMELINTKKEGLKSKIESIEIGANQENVSMEIWQYYALTSVCYQWGNCGQYIQGDNNIARLYKKYYIDEENPQAFRNSALCQSGSGDLVNFFNYIYKNRQEATWILFNEGRFILSDGTEIYASTSGKVVEFALQFVGCTAPEVRTEEDPSGGLFEYVPSAGQNFWADEWCAMFVSYCFDKCGLIDTIDGVYFGCTTKLNLIENTDIYQGPDYTPKPGDVILYTDDGGKTSCHTGIVVSCDGTKIVTVEGNMDNEDNYSSIVRLVESHTVGASDIAGYIVPREE